MDPTAQTIPAQQSTSAPTQTQPDFDAIIQQSQKPPKKKLPLSKIFIVIFAIAVVIFGVMYIGVYSSLNSQLERVERSRSNTPISAAPTTTSQQEEIPYVSQQECESKTGKSCGHSMCDFIPKGKTLKEVCGTRIRKGWYPVTQTTTPSQK